MFQTEGRVGSKTQNMLGLFEEQQGSPGEGTNEQEQSMVGIEDTKIGGNKVR